ncbi:MAG: ATP-binding protein [Patescibacteria group bacterium]
MDRLKQIRRSRQWTKETLHLLDLSQAYTYAQIPQHFWNKKLEGIKDPESVKKIQKYARNIDKCLTEKHLGLFLYGQHGVGKSFLAAYIAMYAIRKDFSAWFYDGEQFKQDLFKAMKDQDTKRKLNRIMRKADLLILDNMTIKRESDGKAQPFIQEQLEILLRRRQNVGALIITSAGNNASLIFEGVVQSLLEEMTYTIRVGGSDLRKQVSTTKFAELD